VISSPDIGEKIMHVDAIWEMVYIKIIFVSMLIFVTFMVHQILVIQPVYWTIMFKVWKWREIL